MVAVEQVSIKNAHSRKSRTLNRQTQAQYPTRNSAARVIAGPFAESVLRIWGEERIGEYLGPQMQDGTFGTPVSLPSIPISKLVRWSRVGGCIGSSREHEARTW